MSLKCSRRPLILSNLVPGAPIQINWSSAGAMVITGRETARKKVCDRVP